MGYPSLSFARLSLTESRRFPKLPIWRRAGGYTGSRRRLDVHTKVRDGYYKGHDYLKYGY